MTVIFGEDGKEILTPVNPKQEKSVYDMEDEDFSATKATPFPGIYSITNKWPKIFVALLWPKLEYLWPSQGQKYLWPSNV